MLDLAIHHRQGDFTLEAELTVGEGLTALFGPSGSGKTTLINIIAGLVRPTEGRIRFNGTTWSDGTTFLPPHRRRIGYVFQEGRLFPHLTVLQNLRYAERLLPRTERREDLDRIASLLGIADLLARRPARLSGGEGGALRLLILSVIIAMLALLASELMARRVRARLQG